MEIRQKEPALLVSSWPLHSTSVVCEAALTAIYRCKAGAVNVAYGCVWCHYMRLEKPTSRRRLRTVLRSIGALHSPTVFLTVSVELMKWLRRCSSVKVRSCRRIVARGRPLQGKSSTLAVPWRLEPCHETTSKIGPHIYMIYTNNELIV